MARLNEDRNVEKSERKRQLDGCESVATDLRQTGVNLVVQI